MRQRQDNIKKQSSKFVRDSCQISIIPLINKNGISLPQIFKKEVTNAIKILKRV